MMAYYNKQCHWKMNWNFARRSGQGSKIDHTEDTDEAA